jgi:hypothetical protein
MSLRKRGGNLHHRFFAAGRSWTADTGLVATEHNWERRIDGGGRSAEAGKRGAARSVEDPGEGLQ